MQIYVLVFLLFDASGIACCPVPCTHMYIHIDVVTICAMNCSVSNWSSCFWNCFYIFYVSLGCFYFIYLALFWCLLFNFCCFLLTWFKEQIIPVRQPFHFAERVVVKRCCASCCRRRYCDTSTYSYIHINTHINIYIYIYIQSYTHKYLYMYIYLYIYTKLYMYVCM